MKVKKNIYHFICSFLIFFLLTALPAVLSGNPDSDTELLKKISTQYIRNTMKTSKTFEEAASQLGLSGAELTRICTMLAIKISDYYVTPEDNASVEKISSKKYFPDVIIDYNSATPYVFLVEKSTHKIFVLKYQNGQRSLEAVFECKTGQIKGDKKEEGDKKTPEGIFFLIARYDRDQISKIVGKENVFQYGELAFVTDFPNHIDRINNKNGGGIWLHGTDESFFDTTSDDTRGCVVTTNETIKKLAQYIHLGKTPLIITENLNFLNKEEYQAARKEFIGRLDTWRKAWEGENTKDYIGHYSGLFVDGGRNREQYRLYKAGIFRNVTINHIKLNDITLFKYNDGLVAQFIQDYSASNMSTKNLKRLYYIKNKNSWEIIAELIRN